MVIEEQTKEWAQILITPDVFDRNLVVCNVAHWSLCFLLPTNPSDGPSAWPTMIRWWDWLERDWSGEFGEDENNGAGDGNMFSHFSIVSSSYSLAAPREQAWCGFQFSGLHAGVDISKFGMLIENGPLALECWQTCITSCFCSLCRRACGRSSSFFAASEVSGHVRGAQPLHKPKSRCHGYALATAVDRELR